MGPLFLEGRTNNGDSHTLFVTCQKDKVNDNDYHIYQDIVHELEVEY